MKNVIAKVFFDKNSKLSVLIVLGIFMLVALGCFGRGGSKSTTPIPSEYYGDWVGQDGTTVSIRADGTGDYHQGGTKVDGGTAEIDDAKKTLSITFFGIGKTMHIDQAPAGDKMTLDNVVFRRSGGFTNSSNSNTMTTPSPVSKNPFSNSNDSSSKSSTDVSPSNSNGALSNNEVETMVKETIADFADAVDKEDFTEFRRTTAKEFQRDNSPAQLDNIFKVFIDQKDKVVPILKGVDQESASFSTPPAVSTEAGRKVLIANGDFPTNPNTTNFETKYVLENGKWKIISVRVKL